jgi:hypothetical protein
MNAGNARQFDNHEWGTLVRPGTTVEEPLTESKSILYNRICRYYHFVSAGIVIQKYGK